MPKRKLEDERLENEIKRRKLTVLINYLYNKPLFKRKEKITIRKGSIVRLNGTLNKSQEYVCVNHNDSKEICNIYECEGVKKNVDKDWFSSYIS